jgi:carbamoyltransferase
MWILGLAGSHNSGAALIKDGKVVVAVQTERLARIKRQAIALEHMEANAGRVLGYCLRDAGIDLRDLSAIATSTPGRALPPRFALRPGSQRLVEALPRFITVPHHLAHAEYALHYSPQKPGMVLVCDGSGTYESDRATLDIQEIEHEAIKLVSGCAKESISAYRFDGRELNLVYRVALGALENLPDAAAGQQRRSGWLASLGHLWEWAAQYCHGSHQQAGKVMGLAPFGDPGVHAQRRSAVVDAEGRVRIDYGPLLRELHEPNVSGADVTGIQHYADLAAHVQQTTNTFLVDLVRQLQARHGTSRLCYAGGVALNGIANEHLRATLGLELHMNGSCEDNGTAVGAALAAHHAMTGQRVPEPLNDHLGRRYSSDEVAQALRDARCESIRLPRDELLRRTACALAAGQVIGWFQGRSEFGPRALGNRSILADPRDPAMQRRLNERIKHREGFRPYAPAVVEHRAAEFFDLDGPSPVMLRVVRVKGDRLPAITHVDGTARVQTVNRAQNPIFHDLLEAFEVEAGVPVLLNTSFNTAGEPIVESPTDALRSFVRCHLDALVLEDHFVAAPEGLR